MWQAIAVIAVPLFSALIGLIKGSGDSRLSRRIKHHAEILKLLDGFGDAAKALEATIVEEVGVLRERELTRARRELNGTNLGLSIFLAVITALATLWLTTFATGHASDPWGWVGVTALAMLALLLAIFTIASFGTIYNPKSTPAKK